MQTKVCIPVQSGLVELGVANHVCTSCFLPRKRFLNVFYLSLVLESSELDLKEDVLDADATTGNYT